MKLLIQLVRKILHLSGKSQRISETSGCGNHVLNVSINFTLETQVILPLLRSDLYATLMECVNGDLSLSLPSWHTDRFAVGVVAASGGYPGPVKKGCVIQGLNDLMVCVSIWN